MRRTQAQSLMSDMDIEEQKGNQKEVKKNVYGEKGSSKK